MATFAKWAMACEKAFWPEGTFIAAYQGNTATAVDDVIDSDKAVSTLRDFMVARDRWVGTATELLEALVGFVRQPLRDAEADHEAALFDPKAQSRAEAGLREARDKAKQTLGKGWPGNPRALSGRLKKAGPALRQIGVAIDWPTRHGDEAPVDWLLIGEIGSERYPNLDRFGGGDVHWGSISSRHFSLGSGV